MRGQISDSSEVDAILENPLIMVSAIPQEEPQIEESKQFRSKNKKKTEMIIQKKPRNMPKKVPDDLKHPSKAIEILKARIRMFWLLRYLLFNLTRNDSESNKLLKINPLLSEQRPVETWTEGLTTKITQSGSNPVEMILCNIRLNQKMEVRHVLVDPDYFILVEILPQEKK